MRTHDITIALLSLMMVPSFARSMPLPHPPEVGTEAVESDSKTVSGHDEKNYPSNAGAVNEGGGSANTNGMSNGLSPNSSGSGTGASQAEETSGIPLGGEDTKGSVQQGK